MDKIDKFLKHNSKYVKLQKPLEAANVCDTARKYANGRFDVISFKDGLLTLGVTSSNQAMEIQLSSTKIIDLINKDLGDEKVKRIRYKIV